MYFRQSFSQNEKRIWSRFLVLHDADVFCAVDSHAVLFAVCITAVWPFINFMNQEKEIEKMEKIRQFFFEVRKKHAYFPKFSLININRY
jgi:hypothetical protein